MNESYLDLLAHWCLVQPSVYPYEVYKGRLCQPTVIGHTGPCAEMEEELVGIWYGYKIGTREPGEDMLSQGTASVSVDYYQDWRQESRTFKRDFLQTCARVWLEVRGGQYGTEVSHVPGVPGSMDQAAPQVRGV